MKSMLQFARDLVIQVEQTCKIHGIEFLLDEKPFTTGNDGVSCSGYFDSELRLLAAATYKPVQEWVTTLAHEYCHLLQWAENADVWKQITTVEPVTKRTASKIVFDHISGIDAPVEILDNSYLAVILMEADCERRTVDLFKSLSAPINLTEYIQKANAYVLFYHIARELGTWYDPLCPPYAIESVWRRMPITFNVDYSDRQFPSNLADYSICLPRSEVS